MARRLSQLESGVEKTEERHITLIIVTVLLFYLWSPLLLLIAVAAAGNALPILMGYGTRRRRRTRIRRRSGEKIAIKKHIGLAKLQFPWRTTCLTKAIILKPKSPP